MKLAALVAGALLLSSVLFGQGRGRGGAPLARIAPSDKAFDPHDLSGIWTCNGTPGGYGGGSAPGVDHFGYPHTNQIHLHERYHRSNYNTIELSMTITDPTKPESGGGVFALALATGHKAWSTPAPKLACLGVTGCSVAPPGAPTVIAGMVFAGSLDGHLRAYETKTGTITPLMVSNSCSVSMSQMSRPTINNRRINRIRV